jgi:hypothetical protein
MDTPSVPINIHISIETSVRILLGRNPCEHDLSMNQVDNVLVPGRGVTSVLDRRLRARLKENAFA